MLNTDAQSTQVKKKMSLEEFVSNNRGIDDGQNLPREQLEVLYVNITTRAIQMAEEGLTGLLTPTLFMDLYRRFRDLPYVLFFKRKFQLNFSSVLLIFFLQLHCVRVQREQQHRRLSALRT